MAEVYGVFAICACAHECVYMMNERLPVQNHDAVVPSSSFIQMSTYRDGASTPTCEAGLFSREFACDGTETKWYQSSMVWLCDAHRYVLTITPKAAL